MYRYIDGVAVLILYLYHLLVTVALRHPHQPAEAADAMVDVNHVVAHLKLLYLLERQSHLAATGLVGAEAVFVEAVEYLVVGEEAHPQAVVGKPLVQGAVDGREVDTRHRRACLPRRHCCRPGAVGSALMAGLNSGSRASAGIVACAENLFQALVLLLAVGKYKQPVALEHIVFERTVQQVEILVEQRLGRSVKRYGGLGQRGVAPPKLYLPEPRGRIGKHRGANQLHILAHLLAHGLLLHLGEALHALGHGLPRKALVVDAGHRIAHKGKVASHQHGVLGQKRQQRHTALYEPCQLGHYLYAVARLARQLCLHLESTYGVDVVAKEIDAERKLATV